MADLAPIADRLAQLLRLLLSTDHGGQALNAAQAIRCTLRSVNSNIHELTDRITEKPNGKLSEADMKLIYDTGFEDGLRAAEKKHHGSSDFVSVNGSLPSWHEIALHRQRNSHRLGDGREREFIDSVTSQTVWREPTPKQEKWLRSIFYKSGGRL